LERERPGLQWRSLWYHFRRRTLHRPVECALACDTPSDRNQRGGPNQISFGKRQRCCGDRGFAEYYSPECRSSHRQYGLFHSDCNRSNEYGSGVEFEWRRL
jgi:hypothetical protein